jgi:hypothetical protein
MVDGKWHENPAVSTLITPNFLELAEPLFEAACLVKAQISDILFVTLSFHA